MMTGCGGPIAAHIDQFAEFLSGEGYASQTVDAKCALATDFNAWIKRRGLTLAELDEDKIQRFHARRRRTRRRGDRFSSIQLLQFLRHLGVTPPLQPKIDRSPLGQQPATLATYYSHLRTLCRWLGKPHLISLIDQRVAVNPALTRRRLVTNKNRSERGAGVKFEDILIRAMMIDERFACLLALIVAFALRSLEACLFCPHLAEGPNGELRVHWGTKGGRPRVLPLPINDTQRAVLEWAKKFAATKSESMIPRGWTLQRWRGRYRWLCRRVGLTRRTLGVTPHSLRHGALLDIYEKLTGVAAAARGGALGITDPAADKAARELIAIFAGHGRASVASVYLGSPKGPQSPT